MSNGEQKSFGLTSVDIYQVDQAFERATRRWTLIQKSLKNAHLKNSVPYRLSVVILMIGIAYLSVASFSRTSGSSNADLMVVCVIVWISAWVFGRSGSNLIADHFKDTITTRKQELGKPEEEWLAINELKFVLFRDAVPKHLRQNPEHLVQLLAYFEARQSRNRSLINEHPFIVFCVGAFLAILSGVASQQDKFVWVALLAGCLIVVALILAPLVPEWFVYKAQKDQQRLEYTERLKFEPLQQS